MWWNGTHLLGIESLQERVDSKNGRESDMGCVTWGMDVDGNMLELTCVVFLCVSRPELTASIPQVGGRNVMGWEGAAEGGRCRVPGHSSMKPGKFQIKRRLSSLIAL